LIGSGATPETVAKLREHSAGVIVGSALRKGGRAGEPLDSARVAAFVRAFYGGKPRASRTRKARKKGKRA
jgi:uncharacterized protein